MGTRLLVGPILCDSFLGGSAPRLRTFELTGISFPGIPELLLSATHPRRTYSFRTPSFRVHFVRDDGYCPLHIGQFCNTFALLRSRPGRARRRFTSPDMLCSPRSHSYGFNGSGEYLEDFVARIDTTLLSSLHATAFYQTVFNVTQFD